ncbi:unnamed protein product [Periconia digitata]|uniref:Uncharacterized protein n=1 Tax=Periconia digitata TaxID=1303443 RepID=A0A9W4XUU9_9PLEO|nr:unnamed protein product [Periconia digitata]
MKVVDDGNGEESRVLHVNECLIARHAHPQHNRAIILILFSLLPHLNRPPTGWQYHDNNLRQLRHGSASLVQKVRSVSRTIDQVGEMVLQRLFIGLVDVLQDFEDGA